jgi:hypothetical protein
MTRISPTVLLLVVLAAMAAAIAAEMPEIKRYLKIRNM